MKLQPLSIPKAELQPLVEQINDRIVKAMRSFSAGDITPGTIFPLATTAFRVPNDGVQYDGDGLPLACRIEFLGEGGRYVPFRFEWDWDSEEKVRQVRLIDSAGRTRATWDVFWTWEGSTSYGGDWYIRRVELRT